MRMTSIASNTILLHTSHSSVDFSTLFDAICRSTSRHADTWGPEPALPGYCKPSDARPVARGHNDMVLPFLLDCKAVLPVS
jgi:hypothetical protein